VRGPAGCWGQGWAGLQSQIAPSPPPPHPTPPPHPHPTLPTHPPPPPTHPAGDRLTRRNRVILAFSLALGVGVSLVPQWAANALWPCTGCSEGVHGLRDALIIVLEEGFCIGALIAIFLNLVLPMETPMVRPAAAAAPPLAAEASAPAPCLSPTQRRPQAGWRNGHPPPALGPCTPCLPPNPTPPTLPTPSGVACADCARPHHQGPAHQPGALVHPPRRRHGRALPGGGGCENLGPTCWAASAPALASVQCQQCVKPARVYCLCVPQEPTMKYDAAGDKSNDGAPTGAIMV
jgi:hypothetical protein